jgi:hypothetical protein
MSKARQLGMRQVAGVHTHASKFGTSMQGGHGLAGIQQTTRIESMFDGMEDLQLIAAELHAHLIDLLGSSGFGVGDFDGVDGLEAL